VVPFRQRQGLQILKNQKLRSGHALDEGDKVFPSFRRFAASN
jgi:hypothetical protein